MEGEIVRRFSATPMKETPEEESTLQVIPLQEKYCLCEETCNNDTVEAAKAKYYFYVNASGKEFLVCEVRVNPEKLISLEAERITDFVKRIYHSGMRVEGDKMILPPYIRDDKNEEYCIRRMTKAVLEWLIVLKGNPRVRREGKAGNDKP